MKIKPEHFETLRALIAPLDTPERRTRAIEAGHSDKRYRWDLTYVLHFNQPESATRFICDTLYDYLVDKHIDTALGAIVPPLSKPFNEVFANA